ncbi:MAG: ABC transporter permease [Deltaproteobacteria bacterium]|nr:ABC transporter permease [Deltaproteobacteria bacterium]
MTTWTLIRRNLGRNRGRTLLTTLAVAFSIFLVCAVMTLPSVRDSILARTANSLRITVHHKAGLTYWLPLAYVQKVRALPHVAGVGHWSWFGGIYHEPKDAFPNFAVDPEAVRDVWPDYSWDPAELEAFKHARNGALVAPRTMEKFGWKIGDEITLRSSIFPVNLTLKIVGRIPQTLSTSLWFSRQYFEETVQPGSIFGYVGMLWVRVDQPEHINTVMAAIDDLFRNSEAETASETERAFISNFFSSFDGLIRIVMLVGFLVVAAIVLIAANTAAMSVRERISEVAVLKTIGFRRRTVFTLLLSEGLLIAVLGGATGAGFAYVILNAGKSTWSPFLGPMAMFIMPVSVLIQGLFLALLVGILAGVIPSRGAARLNVAAALRQIA